MSRCPRCPLSPVSPALSLSLSPGALCHCTESLRQRLEELRKLQLQRRGERELLRGRWGQARDLVLHLRGQHGDSTGDSPEHTTDTAGDTKDTLRDTPRDTKDTLGDIRDTPRDTKDIPEDIRDTRDTLRDTGDISRDTPDTSTEVRVAPPPFSPFTSFVPLSPPVSPHLLPVSPVSPHPSPCTPLCPPISPPVSPPWSPVPLGTPPNVLLMAPMSPQTPEGPPRTVSPPLEDVPAVLEPGALPEPR